LFPLLPPYPGLWLDRIEITDQAVTLSLRTTAPAVPCPRCAQPARQVHSRYTRYARDLPPEWGSGGRWFKSSRPDFKQ